MSDTTWVMVIPNQDFNQGFTLGPEFSSKETCQVAIDQIVAAVEEIKSCYGPAALPFPMEIEK